MAANRQRTGLSTYSRRAVDKFAHGLNLKAHKIVPVSTPRWLIVLKKILTYEPKQLLRACSSD